MAGDFPNRIEPFITPVPKNGDQVNNKWTFDVVSIHNYLVALVLALKSLLRTFEQKMDLPRRSSLAECISLLEKGKFIFIGEYAMD